MGRSLPPNIPPEKIGEIYRHELEKRSDGLIEKLHDFVKLPLETSVEKAEFQVFPDEDGEGGASVWMYLAGKNKRINPIVA